VLLYGFAGLVLLGAIYHIAPQLTGSDYICTKPVKFHFWAMFLGTLLLAGGLGFAGWQQGQALAQPALKAAFLDTLAAGMNAFRLSTLGDLLVLLGSLALLVSLGGLLRGCCRCCASQAAEVKS
jgi:cbb3-type cytochrome oxidase subunit 1